MTMPTPAITPSFSVTQNQDGTISTAATANPSTINWAALLQAIVAALPAILAIISAFSTPATPPVPTPIVPPKQ